MGELGEGGGPVPHSKWEVSVWLCAALVALLMAVTASSAADAVIAGFVAIGSAGGFLWSRRIHRSQSALLMHRVPSELQWALILVAGAVLITALAEPSLVDKVTVGLIAVGLFLLVIAERTRPVPDGAYELESTGGYFDPTTRIGLNRRIWTVRGAWLLGFFLGAVTWLAGESVGFLLAWCSLFGWLMVFEPLVWIVKRRKLGYFAQQDEETSPEASRRGARPG